MNNFFLAYGSPNPWRHVFAQPTFFSWHAILRENIILFEDPPHPCETTGPKMEVVHDSRPNAHCPIAYNFSLSGYPATSLTCKSSAETGTPLPPPCNPAPPPLWGGNHHLGPKSIENTRRHRRQRDFLQGTKGAEADLDCDTMVQICGAPPTPPPPTHRGFVPNAPPKGGNRHFVTAMRHATARNALYLWQDRLIAGYHLGWFSLRPSHDTPPCCTLG